MRLNSWRDLLAAQDNLLEMLVDNHQFRSSTWQSATGQLATMAESTTTTAFPGIILAVCPRKSTPATTNSSLIPICAKYQGKV